MEFTNSALVSFTLISPYITLNRNHIIDSVAIHTTAGNSTARDTCIGFSSKSRMPEYSIDGKDRRASSNYIVDSSGYIAMAAEEKSRTWCTSSPEVDHRSVTIEVASCIGNKEPYTVSDKAWASLVALLVDICTRNKIPGLRWEADKELGKRAAKGSVSEQNIFAHRWFANKSCPGNYLYDNMSRLANEVNAKLVAGGVIDDVPINSEWSNNSDDSSGGSSFAFNPAFSLNLDEIKPYVITLDRYCKLTDSELNKLSENGVIGGLVEAGYLYSSVFHKKQEHFKSPIAHDQVMLLNSKHIPHGFIMDGRAKDTLEADEEIRELSSFVRNLPPVLGVWIRTDFPSTNKALNDLIIDKYYKELVRLGLIRKVGLICDKNLIKRFNWSKHKDHWFMLWEEHVSSESEIREILDPKFFDLAGRYT